jgi:hypothetical protein
VVQRRVGDLTAAWVPNEVQEAMRDLLRARIDTVMKLMRHCACLFDDPRADSRHEKR